MMPGVWVLAATYGRIVGGWEYIWASYGITWAALVVYAALLWRRARREGP